MLFANCLPGLFAKRRPSGAEVPLTRLPSAQAPLARQFDTLSPPDTFDSPIARPTESSVFKTAGLDPHQRIEQLEQQVRALTARQHSQESRIRQYEPLHLLGTDADDRVHLALRSFYRGSQGYYWVVDVDSLRTKLLLRHEFQVYRRTPSDTGSYVTLAKELEQSAFAALRAQTTVPDQPLENAGLTHCQATSEGYVLSVDLCPSRRAFEYELFDELCARSKAEQRAMPVAVCVSGVWAQENKQVLSLLADQQQQGLLDIDWVNHSFGHNYYSDKPYEQNFLLYPGIQQVTEIFETEQILLESGLCPSIFYRLPGLVGDDELLQTFNRLGLVPLGTDAWLAKGEVPTAGSIVLVHGNGNERDGIDKALTLLRGSASTRLVSLHAEAAKHACKAMSEDTDA